MGFFFLVFAIIILLFIVKSANTRQEKEKEKAADIKITQRGYEKSSETALYILAAFLLFCILFVPIIKSFLQWH